jgi:hypothetical protein
MKIRVAGVNRAKVRPKRRKQNSFTEFLLYTTPNGQVKVEIFLRNETVWLTQAKIAELFGVDRSVVTKHLQNIFLEGELDKDATCAKIARVQTEGQREGKKKGTDKVKTSMDSKKNRGSGYRDEVKGTGIANILPDPGSLKESTR